MYSYDRTATSQLDLFGVKLPHIEHPVLVLEKDIVPVVYVKVELDTNGVIVPNAELCYPSKEAAYEDKVSNAVPFMRVPLV